jgi:RsbT co-antagonist protein rsbRD N-terminal domain
MAISIIRAIQLRFVNFNGNSFIEAPPNEVMGDFRRHVEQMMIEVTTSSREPIVIAGSHATESVADILERRLDDVIRDWLSRAEKEPDLTAIPLTFDERTGHLPQLLRDVIQRLRLDGETKAPISEAAGHHGDLRSKQGYTVAMAVEESRLLQVSIFTTLHKSQRHLDFNLVLPAVVIIADEVDAQLKQQMLRFMAADEMKLTTSTPVDVV